MNKQEFLDKQRQRKENFPEEKLIVLKMPSGDEWKHIPFSFTQYAAAVKFPMHLIGKLQSVMQSVKDAPTDISAEMLEIAEKTERIIADATFTKLVYPKVTEEETEDSITADQIDYEDWQFWEQYVMSGGQASTNSFRKQSAGKRGRA